MDGSVAYAFVSEGVRYLSAFYALDSKSVGVADSAGEVPCWIHIASIGEYEGHPAGGFAFTEKSFDEIIKNFDARQTPLNVDYEHQTFNRGLKGAIDSAGWIVQLELRSDGQELWALTNLLPEAAARVKAKQLRHCSPVVIPESTDKKTGGDIGFELRSLALTNDPFLDGLHPIQLTRIAAMTDDEKKKAEAEAAAKADKAKQLAAGGGSADPNDPSESASDEAAEQSAAQAFLESVATAAGSDADTVLAVLGENLDMIVKAVQDAIEKGGTPAENTDRQMRAMTIHVGPVLAPTSDKDAKALTIALKHKDGQIRTLTEQLTVAKTELSGFAKANAAAERAALTAHVTELQKLGFVGKDQQAFDDAFEMFRDKPELAKRVYSMATPPAGLVGDDTDPAAESGTNDKPLLMSQLTETQQYSFTMLRGMGRTEQQALEFIARDAAERASN